jgi:hypothetical protein
MQASLLHPFPQGPSAKELQETGGIAARYRGHCHLTQAKVAQHKQNCLSYLSQGC